MQTAFFQYPVPKRRCSILHLLLKFFPQRVASSKKEYRHKKQRKKCTKYPSIAALAMRLTTFHFKCKSVLSKNLFFFWECLFVCSSSFFVFVSEEGRCLSTKKIRRPFALCVLWASPGGLPLVHLDDGVLVDVLEDVRGVQEYAHGAGGGHREEDVQLQAVDYHRYVLPVFANLQKKWE